mmetsp:Transcript_32458/g.30942  ORF Transcript_32458/g.30942 Transcript_32458/m.30942 type:complete len:141 (-) Transcript_32458:8-430(-)
MGIKDYLISARFVVTIGHLAVLLLLFFSIENNVEVSLGDPGEVNSDDKASFLRLSIGAIILGIICFIIDFSGIFLGTSLFNQTANFIHILFHFIGSIFLSLFITENWSYESLFPIIIASNFIPTLFEVWFIIKVYNKILI